MKIISTKDLELDSLSDYECLKLFKSLTIQNLFIIDFAKHERYKAWKELQTNIMNDDDKRIEFHKD
ncbi:hypothetical protein OGY35_23905 [Citrobacter sp. Ct235]|uniref:hypothetical protein n=1 Tax=Citrobacter sp. Ct235 TaxID=2985157 RepID=UPI002578907E|nr:hypothetical protein [Citrobacter sp. Ct235]MDM2738401.1 hypothetical protein [Citrobacter sp. Ct235]